MSLVQQGIQTARNRKTAMAASVAREGAPPSAMTMWNNEAPVLTRMCRACGTRVLALQNPSAMPVRARELTSPACSMNPK